VPETAIHTVRPYPRVVLTYLTTMSAQVDCVIIDRNMLGLSGTNVLLEIDRRRLALPSVLITGAVDREITAGCPTPGDNDGDGQTDSLRELLSSHYWSANSLPWSLGRRRAVRTIRREDA
jgi:hypothetical protein